MTRWHSISPNQCRFPNYIKNVYAICSFRNEMNMTTDKQGQYLLGLVEERLEVFCVHAHKQNCVLPWAGSKIFRSPAHDKGQATGTRGQIDFWALSIRSSSGVNDTITGHTLQGISFLLLYQNDGNIGWLISVMQFWQLHGKRSVSVLHFLAIFARDTMEIGGAVWNPSQHSPYIAGVSCSIKKQLTLMLSCSQG